MRRQGTIETWNDEKGYGFISPLDGGPHAFVHIKAFASSTRRPRVGEPVTYDVVKDNQGRLRAESARYIRRDPLAGNRSTRAITVALLFIAAVGLSAWSGNLSTLVPVIYGTMSVITYIAYCVDKSAARSGRWRISEATLHLLALLGGWPGALAAQQSIRHKSKKRSFRVVFWATVLANCAALAWLHLSGGQAGVDQLLTLLHMLGA